MADDETMAAASELRSAPEDDAALIARAAAGDERAFATIYKRYARYVAGVAFRLIGDESELDDVVQETFLDAAEGLHAIRDASTLKAWLVTIAARKVSKRIAKRQRQRWLGGWLGRSAPRSAQPRSPRSPPRSGCPGRSIRSRG
jgi:RNA polymerase sigma-70 factor (ECF subfamily)